MSNRNKKGRRLIKQEQNQPLSEYGVGVFTEFRKSPFPPPAELEKYEALYSGVTKLIFDNFVTQTNHRMHLEKITIENDNKRANNFCNTGILAFLCIGAGSLLTYLGKDAVGLSLIIGSVGTLLTAFYGGAIIRKIERSQKWKNH